MNWNPIVTAPKDGTPILVCYDVYNNTLTEGGKQTYPFTAYWGRYTTNNYSSGKECWRDMRGNKCELVSYWTELPEPPDLPLKGTTIDDMICCMKEAMNTAKQVGNCFTVMSVIGKQAKQALFLPNVSEKVRLHLLSIVEACDHATVYNWPPEFRSVRNTLDRLCACPI